MMQRKRTLRHPKWICVLSASEPDFFGSKTRQRRRLAGMFNFDNRDGKDNSVRLKNATATLDG
jgi:hypothetical protein